MSSIARQQAISQLDTQILDAQVLLDKQKGKPLPPNAGQDAVSGLIANAPDTVTVEDKEEPGTGPQTKKLSRFLSGILQQVGRSGKQLERVPMPTGLSVPLFILLYLFSALIPVNGNTRLAWFWLVFIGAASIQSNPAAPSGNLGGFLGGNLGTSFVPPSGGSAGGINPTSETIAPPPTPTISVPPISPPVIIPYGDILAMSNTYE